MRTILNQSIICQPINFKISRCIFFGRLKNGGKILDDGGVTGVFNYSTPTTVGATKTAKGVAALPILIGCRVRRCTRE